MKIRPANKFYISEQKLFIFFEKRLSYFNICHDHFALEDHKCVKVQNVIFSPPPSVCILSLPGTTEPCVQLLFVLSNCLTFVFVFFLIKIKTCLSKPWGSQSSFFVDDAFLSHETHKINKVSCVLFIKRWLMTAVMVFIMTILFQYICNQSVWTLFIWIKTVIVDRSESKTCDLLCAVWDYRALSFLFLKTH